MAFNQNSLNLVRSSSQAVSIVDAASLKQTGNFTIEAWVKTSSGTTNQTIFQSYSQNSNVAGILFVVRSTGVVDVTVGDNTGVSTPSDYVIATSTGTVNDGKWHWIVVTRDGTNVKIYIDDVEDGSVAWSTAQGYAATNYVRIGCQNNSGTNLNFFDGQLDQIAFFSDVRTESERLSDKFNNSISDAALQGYWKFESDLLDETANNNDGTGIASPTYSTNVPWTGANTTDWSGPLEIQSDPTKVSGSSDLTDFPALIADSNLSSAVYAGLNGSQYSLGLTSSAAVSMAEHADFDATSAFTVGAWIKTTNNAFMVIAQNYDRNTTPIRTGWYLAKVAGGAIRILTSDNIDDGNNNHEGTNTDSQDGNWHFIVATYDGSNLATFVDGVADGSTASASPPAYGTTYPRIGCLRDGGAGGSNSLFWDGKIDGFFFINGTAWTEAQVQQYMGLDLADQGVSNLVTYQRFDNNLNDSSGSTNTHNGSAIGTPTYSSTDIAKQLQAPDLRITTDAEGTTEIPFEIVALDKVSETAEIWAKVPTLAYATSTSLYIWYGNSSAVAYDADAPFGSQAVWSDYGGVWHLNESSGTRYDSTANANHLTDNNTVGQGTGKIDKSANFVRTSSEWLSKTDVASLKPGSGNFTAQAWVKNESPGMGSTVTIMNKLGDDTGAGSDGWTYGKYSDDKMFFYYNDTAGSQLLRATSTTLSVDTYYHLSVVRAAAAERKILINGLEESYSAAVTSLSASVDNTKKFVLGSYNPGSEYIDGDIDEARFIKTALTADWITTEYNNQNAPSTFWTTVSGSRRYYAPGIWR